MDVLQFLQSSFTDECSVCLPLFNILCCKGESLYWIFIHISDYSLKINTGGRIANSKDIFKIFAGWVMLLININKVCSRMIDPVDNLPQQCPPALLEYCFKLPPRQFKTISLCFTLYLISSETEFLRFFLVFCELPPRSLACFSLGVLFYCPPYGSLKAPSTLRY